VRRSSQIFFFGLFVLILWSTTYPLKGVFSPGLIFKIDPLVMGAVSLSERVLLPGLGLAAGMLLLSVFFGRFFCGWVCPLGAFNDWVSSWRARKRPIGEAGNRRLRRIKYGILAAVVLCALGGVQAAWVFDPLVIIARFVSLNLIPTVTLAADKSFVFLIQTLGAYDSWLYDVYRELKASVLGVRVHYFETSGVIFAVFVAVVLPALWFPRIWCRALCPLGALYAAVSRRALLERRIGGCVDCGLCRKACRMAAIREDGGTRKPECILCMDCLYACRAGKTEFVFGLPGIRKKRSADTGGGIDRKQFLFLAAASVWGTGCRQNPGGFLCKDRGRPAVLRPPGVECEGDFLDRCIRCGNCMKVCVTNGLQPAMLESGPEGIWTPKLVPEIGYCEYNCTLCGRVCPTGAIPELTLEEKQKAVIGVARIDEDLCIAYAEDKECIVCEEHCPVADKAIVFEDVYKDGRRIPRPRVLKKLCIGCGICQAVCPVEPVRAIRVCRTGKMKRRREGRGMRRHGRGGHMRKGA